MGRFFGYVALTGVYLFLFGVGLILSPSIQAYFYPVDKVFEVRSVIVEDAPVGVAPTVHYDRVIKEPFEANWSVEIDLILDDKRYLVCAGYGRNTYDPRDVADELDLSWYVGKDCELDAGTYMMTTIWEIDYGYIFPAKVRYVSPRFKIFEIGQGRRRRQ